MVLSWLKLVRMKKQKRPTVIGQAFFMDESDELKCDRSHTLRLGSV